MSFSSRLVALADREVGIRTASPDFADAPDGAATMLAYPAAAWRRLTGPLAAEWRTCAVVAFTVLAALDALTTSLMVTPGTQFSEANSPAAWGQAHLGMVPYCFGSAVIILAAASLLLAGQAPKRWFSPLFTLCGLGLFAAKAVIVANNLVVWTGGRLIHF